MDGARISADVVRATRPTPRGPWVASSARLRARVSISSSTGLARRPSDDDIELAGLTGASLQTVPSVRQSRVWWQTRRRTPGWTALRRRRPCHLRLPPFRLAALGRAVAPGRDRGSRGQDARALEAFAYRYREGTPAAERFLVHRTVFPRDFLADFRSVRSVGRIELTRLDLGGPPSGRGRYAREGAQSRPRAVPADACACAAGCLAWGDRVLSVSSRQDHPLRPRTFVAGPPRVAGGEEGSRGFPTRCAR